MVKPNFWYVLYLAILIPCWIVVIPLTIIWLIASTVLEGIIVVGFVAMLLLFRPPQLCWRIYRRIEGFLLWPEVKAIIPLGNKSGLEAFLKGRFSGYKKVEDSTSKEGYEWEVKR